MNTENPNTQIIISVNCPESYTLLSEHQPQQNEVFRKLIQLFLASCRQFEIVYTPEKFQALATAYFQEAIRHEQYHIRTKKEGLTPQKSSNILIEYNPAFLDCL